MVTENLHATTRNRLSQYKSEMPFGIIDVKHDGKLPGTELLIEDDRAAIVPGVDVQNLKTVMHKVCVLLSSRQPWKRNTDA